MTLDLSEFNRRHEFEFESAILGRLHCRVLSLNVLSALEKIMSDTSLNGRPFVEKLLETIVERVPETEEEGMEPKQEGMLITAEEATQFTDDEIEVFARDFLAHNPSLLETDDGATTKVLNEQEG